MAQARFFRISAFGGYASGSEWAGETWQFGFSSVSLTDGTLPSREVIRANMPICDVEPSSTVNTQGGFVINYGFLGQLGNAMDVNAQYGICQKVKTFYDAVKIYMSNQQQLEGVKITAYAKGADGKPEVINGSTLAYLQTPDVGTSATWRLPPQCATVISMRSGTRGPGGRGRAYIPATAATLSTDGGVSSAERTALLTAMNNLGQTIAGTNRTLLCIANASVDKTGSVPFTYSGIAQYGVGNHIDTQRRRARGVPETYDFVNALF